MSPLKKAKIDNALAEFSKALVEKYDGFIKAIWVYGSYAKGEAKPTSDIDVMILVDDVTKKVSIVTQNEIFLFSRFLAGRVRDKYKLKNEIHIQPPRGLTDWWDLLRSGEPWVFTGMRDSRVLYDPSGFVEPIKRLLMRGGLHGTKEKSFALLRRAKRKYEDLKKKLTIDVTSKILGAMVETAQAVLMYYGEPPVYEDTLIRKMKFLAKKNLIKKRHVEHLKKVYEMARKEEKEISLRDVDKIITFGMEFIEAMEKLFEKLELKKKKKIIKESHDEMMRIATKILKSFGYKARGEKDVIRKLKLLVKKGYITPLYLEFIKHVLELKKKIDMGKIEFLSEKDIYGSRVYVKTLESLSEMMKK